MSFRVLDRATQFGYGYANHYIDVLVISIECWTSILIFTYPSVDEMRN